jgi:hypothetical protein
MQTPDYQLQPGGGFRPNAQNGMGRRWSMLRQEYQQSYRDRSCPKTANIGQAGFANDQIQPYHSPSSLGISSHYWDG